MDVVPDHIVRHDDDIDLVDLRLESRAIAWVPGIQQGREVRRVGLDFMDPVACERRRTHDQRRDAPRIGRLCLLPPLIPLMMLARQERNGLQCFSETHIVAQNAVQLVSGKEGHPADAVHLVRPELDLHLDRHLVRRDFGAVHQLSEERLLGLAASEQRWRKVGRVGQAVNQRQELDELGKRVRRQQPDRLVAVVHAAEHRHDKEEHVRQQALVLHTHRARHDFHRALTT